MSRRILLATFETPGYGGASTATYALYERLQQDGFDVAYLNLIDADQEHFLRTTFGPAFDNPRGLADVRTYVLECAFHRPQPRLGELLDALAPDVVLCVGFIAALAVKQAAPSRKVILYTSGCDRINRSLRRYGDAVGVCAALRATVAPLASHEARHLNESRAVELADLILVHSDLVRELFGHFYPSAVGKIYPDTIWMAEWIHGEAARYAALARPFEARDVDLLFIASRWDRAEKNLPLLRAIVAGCPELSAHIVGMLEVPVAASTCHGLLPDRAAFFALMGRARVVVSPSLFDAAPGVLYEASALGCNVVASQNCGNWMLCHESLVATPCAAAPFMAAVRRAVAAPWPDRMPQLLAARSYATLADICEVC